MALLSIRGNSGLGDAIYVQSVARQLIEHGHRVEVCSDWPDVFLPLGESCFVSPFRRERIDRLAAYSARRGVSGSTQFEDCCIQAGILCDLRLGWRPRRIDHLVDTDKPLVVVPMPRAPFDRKDGFGVEFLPDCRVIQRAIYLLRNQVTVVQVGKGEPSFRFDGIDCDLANRTSVRELLDVACHASAFLGFCSFIVPLAEALCKPALLVWSRRGLRSPHLVVRQMTPQKVLHRPSSRHVIDDCPAGDLARAVDALLDEVRSPIAV